MTKDQKEYNEFWTDVLNKAREVQKKYNDLSEENKLRADSVRSQLFTAQSLLQVMVIIMNQISG